MPLPAHIMDKLLLKALIAQLTMHLSGLNEPPAPGNTIVVLDSLSDMHAVFMGLTACIKALRSGNEMYSFSVEDRAVVFSSVHQFMGLSKADKDVENSCNFDIAIAAFGRKPQSNFDESIPHVYRNLRKASDGVPATMLRWYHVRTSLLLV